MLGACLGSTVSLPSERPFRASSSGSLLEFLQPRSFDRGASVSSSFPLFSGSVGPRSSSKVRSEPMQALEIRMSPFFPPRFGKLGPGPSSHALAESLRPIAAISSLFDFGSNQSIMRFARLSSNMKLPTLLIAMLMTCTSPVNAQEHLEPERDAFGVADSYDQKVRQLFDEGFKSDVRLKVLILESFATESLVGIRKTSDGFEAFHLRAQSSIGDTELLKDFENPF